MDVLTCIETRRSIRGFEKKEITKEQLTILAEAARSAPTAMNLQTRRITVVQNKEMLEKLRAVIGEELGRESYNFYFPDALIIASDTCSLASDILDCTR